MVLTLKKIFGSHLTWKPAGNFPALMMQSSHMDTDGLIIIGQKSHYYMMVFMAPWVV